MPLIDPQMALSIQGLGQRNWLEDEADRLRRMGWSRGAVQPTEHPSLTGIRGALGRPPVHLEAYDTPMLPRPLLVGDIPLGEDTLLRLKGNPDQFMASLLGRF